MSIHDRVEWQFDEQLPVIGAEVTADMTLCETPVDSAAFARCAELREVRELVFAIIVESDWGKD